MGNKQFGVWFILLREKQGFKDLEQLALLSGVSKETLARIESGIEKPTPELLNSLAIALKVPKETLLQAAGY